MSNGLHCPACGSDMRARSLAESYSFTWGPLSMLCGIASLAYASYAAINVSYVTFED